MSQSAADRLFENCRLAAGSWTKEGMEAVKTEEATKLSQSVIVKSSLCGQSTVSACCVPVS